MDTLNMLVDGQQTLQEIHQILVVVVKVQEHVNMLLQRLSGTLSCCWVFSVYLFILSYLTFYTKRLRELYLYLSLPTLRL